MKGDFKGLKGLKDFELQNEGSFKPLKGGFEGASKSL